MGFRTWISVITLGLLSLVVFFAWDEIVAAFDEFGGVNLWVLALIIPVQVFSYFATGEIMFTYLRSKGSIKGLNRRGATRLALEFNFVNHVFPSGGAAGMTYMAWKLSHYGVRPGRATMSQIIRYSMTFVSFILLLVVALVVLIIDHTVTRHALLISLLIVVAAVVVSIIGLYLLSSKRRLTLFAGWLTRFTNRTVTRLSRGRKPQVVEDHVILDFFTDIHDDYVQIRRDKGLLKKPFLWSIVTNLADVALLFIAFASFGVYINPAMLFIAFGLSSMAAAITITPGGAGGYEAVMIAFLATAGVAPHIAIAGTLLARVMLLIITIVSGYIFYQLTLVRHGKSPIKR